MAFTFGNAISLAGFATDYLQKQESFDAASQQAARANAKRIADARIRNETLARNQELIAQEKMLEMKAFGFDANLIYKQTRAAKATALAKFGSSGSLDSNSLNMHVTNIARQGADARRARSYNYGIRVRQLGVEAEGLFRSTVAANNSANYVEAPSQTGLSLSNLGLGIDVVDKLGFKTDPKTKKRVFSFGTG